MDYKITTSNITLLLQQPQIQLQSLFFAAAAATASNCAKPLILLLLQFQPQKILQRDSLLQMRQFAKG